MSTSTPNRTSFRKMLKKKLTPRPAAIIPILQLVVQASAAFTPLQSAAGGLLKIMELVDVRHRLLSPPILR